MRRYVSRRYILKALTITGIQSLGPIYNPWNNQLQIERKDEMPLYQQVITQLVKVNHLFESYYPYIYLDVKGLPTTGYGFLLKDAAAALKFNWYYTSTGRPVPATQVIKNWERVADLKTTMTGRRAGDFAPFNTMEIRREDADQIMLSRIEENYRTFQSQRNKKNERPYRNFGDFPANAQLATLSMSWGAGVSGVVTGFPMYTEWVTQAIKNNSPKYWRNAAEECKLKEKGNPGVVPRNLYNQALLNALADRSEIKVEPEKFITEVTPLDIRKYAYPGVTWLEVKNV